VISSDFPHQRLSRLEEVLVKTAPHYIMVRWRKKACYRKRSSDIPLLAEPALQKCRTRVPFNQSESVTMKKHSRFPQLPLVLSFWPVS
jgi:hypothetical protein